MEVVEVPVEWIKFIEDHPITEDTLRYIVGTYNAQNQDTVTLVRDLIAPEAAPVQAEIISLEPEEEYGDPSIKQGKTETTLTAIEDEGEEKELK